MHRPCYGQLALLFDVAAGAAACRRSRVPHTRCDRRNLSWEFNKLFAAASRQAAELSLPLN